MGSERKTRERNRDREEDRDRERGRDRERNRNRERDGERDKDREREGDRERHWSCTQTQSLVSPTPGAGEELTPCGPSPLTCLSEANPCAASEGPASARPLTLSEEIPRVSKPPTRIQGKDWVNSSLHNEARRFKGGQEV